MKNKRYNPTFASDKKRVIEDQDYRCGYCGMGLHNLPFSEIHIDHFIAISLGGKDYIGNYVAACKKCNLRKSSLSPQKFLDGLLRQKKYYEEELERIRKIIPSLQKFIETYRLIHGNENTLCL